MVWLLALPWVLVTIDVPRLLNESMVTLAAGLYPL
jgi:hypothetical protein